MPFLKALMATFTILVSFISVAGTHKIFPNGCEVSGFAYSQNYLILNETGKQSYYLIQNRSNLPLELKRYETSENFMNPPLVAKIDQENWAAFASDIENLHFECSIYENDSNKIVNCRDVLEVCQYPRVKFALSNMGNYWVSVNKTQTEIINESTAKGIYLRW